MDRQLIFFDIDGTILSENGTILNSTVCAIQRAREQGNLCVVNTGRPYAHIHPAVKKLMFDGLICSCGQHIVVNNAVAIHQGFDHEESLHIAELVYQYGMDAVYEGENGVWHETRNGGIDAERSKQYFAKLGFQIGRNLSSPDFAFDKLCVWTYAQSDVNRFLKAIESDFDVIDRGRNLLELVKKGCSKATGIRYVRHFFDIQPENTWSIGDSPNDMPMFEATAHRIAMGNAEKEVKKAVDYVTEPIEQDGLSNALYRFHLAIR